MASNRFTRHDRLRICHQRVSLLPRIAQYSSPREIGALLESRFWTFLPLLHPALMDIFLFQNLVKVGELPADGPLNVRRSLAYLASVWLQGPHEDVPPCDFGDYLGVRGWDKEKLKRGLWRDAHPDNSTRSDDDCTIAAISTIQSWLTLGFLESVFQERIPIDKYTRSVSLGSNMYLQHMWQHGGVTVFPHLLGRSDITELRIFHTKNLVSNLVGLSFRHYSNLGANRDPHEHVRKFRAAYIEFANALGSLNLIDTNRPESNSVESPQVPDTKLGYLLHYVLLFPALLGETISLHLSSMVPDVDITDPRLFTNQFVKKMLIEDNRWCPYTLKKLRVTTQFSVLYWLWALDLNDLSIKSHSECDEKVCKAYRVSNESSYPTHHVAACSGYCEMLHLNMNIMTMIYESKGTPVIVASKNTDPAQSGAYVFDIARSDPSDSSSNPYAAFSHVWADGFGSTTEQGMPMCQVEFLVDAASSVQESKSDLTTFWIDSLCIPEDRRLRRKAIESMADVYKSAASVIVLDRTLQKCSVKASPEELLLRIYTSPWMNRVWTYQEGLLSKKLYFKFSDANCLLNIPPLDMDVAGPLHIPMFHDHLHDIYKYLVAQVQNVNSAVTPGNISNVASELRWRDTLHRDPKGKNDELVAVGVLLGLDMSYLLEARGVERMARFLLMVKKLPRNIIFSQVERLQFAGFRWAPTTFLVQDDRRPSRDLDNTGVVCTPDGLLGSYIVFEVDGSLPAKWVGNKRHTVIDTQLKPTRWFDIIDDNRTDLLFDYIIIYPEEAPQSIRATILVAAAALKEHPTATFHRPSIIEGQTVELVCTYQRIVHLSVFRDFSSPVNPHLDPSPVLIHGKFRRRTILLR